MNTLKIQSNQERTSDREFVKGVAVTKFIVMYKTPGKESLPGWNKVGFISHTKRLSADEGVKSHFNPKTKFYTQVLSHCRFLLEETSARDVDFHLVGKTGPTILYRVHKCS